MPSRAGGELAGESLTQFRRWAGGAFSEAAIAMPVTDTANTLIVTSIIFRISLWTPAGAAREQTKLFQRAIMLALRGPQAALQAPRLRKSTLYRTGVFGAVPKSFANFGGAMLNRVPTSGAETVTTPKPEAKRKITGAKR